MLDSSAVARAASFILDPATGSQTFVPQTGNAWRPSVDPTGRQAVYWTGKLRATSDGPGFAPESGRLVLGTWDTGTGDTLDPDTTAGLKPPPPPSSGRDGGTVTEQARVVVGADGRHSAVARAVAPEQYHERPPLLCGYYSYWSGVELDTVEDPDAEPTALAAE